MYLQITKKISNHNPSFKSCLLRIPGTINSKNGSEVKIIQRFDENKIPSIDNHLLREFRLYLADIDIRKKRMRKVTNRRRNSSIKSQYHSSIQYKWIEKLLETPIEDGRKYTLWKILCPYLVNIKKMSPEESFLILDNWLDQCDMMKVEGYNKHTLIKNKLRYVNNYKPISHERLKKENNELYNKIVL